MSTSMNWRSLWVTILWILHLNYALVLKHWWRSDLIFRRHLQTYASPGYHDRNNAGQTHHKGTPSIICLHWPVKITYHHFLTLYQDVQLTVSNDDQYFVFEDVIFQIMLCFSRDTEVDQEACLLTICIALRNFSLTGVGNLLVWLKQPGKGSAKRTGRRSSWQSGHLPTKVEIHPPG